MARGLTVACVPDSFKGSLSSERISQIVGEQLEAVIPGSTLVSAQLGDGGEGTLAAVRASVGGTLRSVAVEGPLGAPARGEYLELPDGDILMECASAVGITLVDRRELDPMRASSAGLGQLMRACLDHACGRVVIGLGGSATCDGGMGCLRALGVRFFDADGRELAGCGADLARVAHVDALELDGRLADVEVRLMCDVTNPLLGADGAVYVFAPQKGATPVMCDELERGMRSYIDVLECAFGRSVRDMPGAGAAGGLGAALACACAATTQSGVDAVLDLIGFDETIRGCDLCVTGEGAMDAQTLGGKAVAGVAARAAAAGVPCVAICGAVTPSVELADAARELGVTASVPCVTRPCSVEEAMAGAEANLALAARRTFELVALGRTLA